MSFMDSDIANTIEDGKDKKYTAEMYKYWFQTKSMGGFLSITPWLQTNKISIDIGSTSGGSSLSGNTKLYTNTLDLYAYLTAVSNGTAPIKYPATDKAPEESFVYFGGGNIDGKIVSRVLKIEYWGDGDKKDKRAFAWKTAHFQGKSTSSGAILPQNMGRPISYNAIKIPRIEMDKIQQLLHFTLQSYATRNGDEWYKWEKK